MCAIKKTETGKNKTEKSTSTKGREYKVDYTQDGISRDTGAYLISSIYRRSHLFDGRLIMDHRDQLTDGTAVEFLPLLGADGSLLSPLDPLAP